MPSSNQTTGLSASNFTLIFDAGLDEYKRLTKHDLRTHSFAAELGACDSPDTVLKVFQGQTQAFSKPHKGEEKLLKWLKPTVHVLFSVSATLGTGISLVSPSFLPYQDAPLHICLLAIPPRQRNFHWDRRSPWGRSRLTFLKER
jgi:hypothetical protein